MTSTTNANSAIDERSVLPPTLGKHQSSDGKSSCNNAGYWLMKAIKSQLDSASACLDDDSEALLKRAIQETLQSIDDVQEKIDLLNFVAKSTEGLIEKLANKPKYAKTVHCMEGFLSWVKAHEKSLESYQDKIKDAVKQYKQKFGAFSGDLNSLQGMIRFANKLKQVYHSIVSKEDHVKTHWYEPWTYFQKEALRIAAAVIMATLAPFLALTAAFAYLAVQGMAGLTKTRFGKWFHGLNEPENLRKEKDGLEAQVNSIFDKNSFSSEDLGLLHNDLSQLQSIIKGQGGFKKPDKEQHEHEIVGMNKGGPIPDENLKGTGDITGDEANAIQVGFVVLGVGENVKHFVGNLDVEDLVRINKSVQLTKKGEKNYVDVVKGARGIVDTFSQMSQLQRA